MDSKPGQGTKFVVKLPLTLAIIQALMVAAVMKFTPFHSARLMKQLCCPLKTSGLFKPGSDSTRGNVLPLYRLDSLLEVPGETVSDESYVVVVYKGNKQIGLVVDRLIGQQEIVIKSLGKVLAGTPGIAGAIVAGDGNVRLILDIDTLF